MHATHTNCMAQRIEPTSITSCLPPCGAHIIACGRFLHSTCESGRYFAAAVHFARVLVLNAHTISLACVASPYVFKYDTRGWPLLPCGLLCNISEAEHLPPVAIGVNVRTNAALCYGVINSPNLSFHTSKISNLFATRPPPHGSGRRCGPKAYLEPPTRL